jgi:hypothetical protein
VRLLPSDPLKRARFPAAGAAGLVAGVYIYVTPPEGAQL